MLVLPLEIKTALFSTAALIADGLGASNLGLVALMPSADAKPLNTTLSNEEKKNPKTLLFNILISLFQLERAITRYYYNS